MDNGKVNGKNVGRAYRKEMDKVVLSDGARKALRERVLAQAAEVGVATAAVVSPVEAAAPKGAALSVENGPTRGRHPRARRSVRWAVALAAAALEASTQIACDGFGTIESVTVTPFSIGFLARGVDTEARPGECSPQVSIIYQDGRTVDYPGVFDEMTWESVELFDQGIVTLSSIGSIEDYEDIVALAIDGTRVDFSRP